LAFLGQGFPFRYFSAREKDSYIEKKKSEKQSGTSENASKTQSRCASAEARQGWQPCHRHRAGVEVDRSTVTQDMVATGARFLARPTTADLTEAHKLTRVELGRDLLQVDPNVIIFPDESLFDCSDPSTYFPGRVQRMMESRGEDCQLWPPAPPFKKTSYFSFPGRAFVVWGAKNSVF
jgi:hypothetical protein